MVQDDGPSQYASAEITQVEASTGNKAADRLKQSEGSHRTKSHSQAKQPQARQCLGRAPRQLGDMVRSQSKQLA